MERAKGPTAVRRRARRFHPLWNPSDIDLETCVVGWVPFRIHRPGVDEAPPSGR